MGSHEESVTLSMIEVDAILAQKSRSYSKAEEILSAALRDWDENEASRYESFNGGPALMFPVTPGPLITNRIRERMGDDFMRKSPVVPIMDEKDYVIKKRKVTVKLNDDEWHEYSGPNSYEFIQRKIAEQLPEEVRRDISGYRVLIIDPNTGKEAPKKFFGERTDGWKISSSIEADTSGGKAKTVYRLVVDGRIDPRSEHETMAAARAAGVAYLDAHPAALKVEVIGEVKREDKTALVKLSRKVRSAIAKFEVSYVQVKSQTPRTEGYFVSFSYHS